MSPQASAPSPETGHDPYQRRWIGAMNYFDLILFYGIVIGGSVYIIYNMYLKFMEGYHDTNSVGGALLVVWKWEGKETRERKKALKNLPPPIKYKIQDEENQETNTCTICLDDFTKNELCQVLPKCDHIFHFVCINPWLKNHRNCPICRAKIG